MKELNYNIRCILNRKELYLAIFLIFLVNIIHVFLVVQTCGGQKIFIENSYSAEYQSIVYNGLVNLDVLVVIIFPILCTLIFSDSNWLDKNLKRDIFLFNRLNYRKSCFIKLFIIFIISFLICFAGFVFNYLLLSIIFENGTTLSYFQSTGFYLTHLEEFAFDLLRISDPVVFLLVLTIIKSIFISLLSCMAYSFSFFIKKRILIYFLPLLISILCEIISSVLNLKFISLIKFLQPLPKYNIENVIFSIISIFVISIVLIFYNTRKRDILL